MVLIANFLHPLIIEPVQTRVTESKQNQFDSDADSEPFFQFDSNSDFRALFPFDSDSRLFKMVKFRLLLPQILLT